MKTLAQREIDLIANAVKALEGTTGATANIIGEPPHRGFDFGLDAIIEIAIAGKKLLYLAEAKRGVPIPAHLKTQLERVGHHWPRHRPMLVTPFMTREMAEKCRAIDLAFLDLAGNAYLNADGVYVYITGRPKPKDTMEAEYRAARTAGLRFTIALLCDPTLANKTYREIAKTTGVALGAIGPIIHDLERRRYLRRTDHHVRMLNGLGLFNEWLERFPVALRPKLNPRRYQTDRERLLHLNPANYQALWGGEVAADKLTGNLKPEHFTLYLRGPATPLLADLRMRQDPNGNADLLDAFWPAEVEKPGAIVAPPLIVYTDLVTTGEARNREIAKLIYERDIAPALSPA